MDVKLLHAVAGRAKIFTRVEFTLLLIEDFADSENNGFLLLDGGKVRVRLFGNAGDYDLADPKLPEGIAAFIKAVKDNYSYLIG